MTDKDYREILEFARQTLKQAGFGGIDERIMSDMRGPEGPFWDLVYYLKRLTEELALGSDVQQGNVLRRIRRHVETESGQPVEGVRVVMSDEDRKRYDLEYIEFVPNPQFGEIAQELRALINELREDHQMNDEK